jgi:hypothetical protein
MKQLSGGKMDDITVLIAFVEEVRKPEQTGRNKFYCCSICNFPN